MLILREFFIDDDIKMFILDLFLRDINDMKWCSEKGKGYLIVHKV